MESTLMFLRRLEEKLPPTEGTAHHIVLYHDGTETPKLAVGITTGGARQTFVLENADLDMGAYPLVEAIAAMWGDPAEAFARSGGEPIKVWAFHSAPEGLRKLSENGGDEDWLALLPYGWDDTPLWMQSGSLFGVFSVDEYDYQGQRVLIGCHA